MRQWSRLSVVFALSVFPVLGSAHGSFQCLAELEHRALDFARCSRSAFVCEDAYQSMVDQMSSCREIGFANRLVEQAVQRGYAQVPAGDAIPALNMRGVAGQSLTAMSNWHRFRMVFGGFFDHDKTLLGAGFTSQRCGNAVEGSSDSVHWVARLKFRDVDQQIHQWDFFEKVEPHRCYARTPGTLLVANIPYRFLKFYRGVWLQAFPNRRVVECQDRDRCQTEIEDKNRQFLHYRALVSALENWRSCDAQPEQSHCMGEDWRREIVRLEREQGQAWQLITQLHF